MHIFIRRKKKNLNISGTVTLLEEKILDIGLSSGYVDMTPRAQATEANKWDYLKFKSFYTAI